MGAFLDVSKALLIPAAVAATLYALFTYLLLPFYRNHYARYRQYLPLSVSSSTNAHGLRTRFTDWLVNAMIPNSMRWGRDGDVVRYTSATDPDGSGARRGGDSFDSEVYVFGEEEGERLVGFDHERLPRGRDERGGVVEVASDRRLSRELEAGFKDESSEESGDDGRRGVGAFSSALKLRLRVINTNILIRLLPRDWLSAITMWDEEAGVEVYIRPYDSDTAHREYEAPRSSPLYTGQKNERYIEAVNDERFEMFARLDPAFDFKKYAEVNICMTIDGGGISCNSFLAKPKRNGELSQVLDGAFSCEDVEDQHLTREEEEDEASNRGRIVVTVQLGRKKRINGKFNVAHSYAFPRETSKKVAVDKGRSHSVATMPIDFEATEEQAQNHEWMPAEGDAGKEITFTFFYASRMILELKNIIATTDNAPAKRTGGGQTSNNEDMESRNEETAPLIVTTGSDFPKKPKQIINLDSDDEEERPPKKIKTEVTEGMPRTRTASGLPATSTANSSKDRERARIESRLEDIRLQREENRLKRQMMDLEDGA
ncbi:hypothetical protein KC360_g4443 [Hortaea werneckii]|nr:hypothetical protein KC325_g624 [Hortaea werneckii]KAI7001052.1 hypothetical protein KC359_g818 [Hortaea werneckii]KAI7145471.1 hypothetical protein KC344_g4446 [Hortaea werneckii]KAI7174226.1 hypothetical protein KC360_g4443 [Hortaea werneckii]